MYCIINKDRKNSELMGYLNLRAGSSMLNRKLFNCLEVLVYFVRTFDVHLIPGDCVRCGTVSWKKKLEVFCVHHSDICHSNLTLFICIYLCGCINIVLCLWMFRLIWKKIVHFGLMTVNVQSATAMLSHA